MTIDSGNILFFFGAGASAEFGIPTMTKMAQDFRLELTNKGSKPEKDIYNEIIEILARDINCDVDIEAIFSVIQGLKEYSPTTIGELALYISRKKYDRSLVNSLSVDVATLESLESRFQQFIRKSCRLKSDYRDKMITTYKEFFNIISNHVNNQLNSDKPVKYDTRWTLFTTNYDRCLEAFWRDDMQINLDTGFRKDETSFDSAKCTLNADNFLCSFGGSLQFQKTCHTRLRLVKLHGSVTWLRRKGNQEIEETIYDIDLGKNEHGTGSVYTDEVVIYPLREKRLYLDPYIQMLYCLNRELENKRLWIVTGYSFRDPVIQNIFTSALDRCENMKMILVTPDANKLIKERLELYHKRIVPVERCFGKEDDSSIINSSIAKELDSL